MTVTLGTDMSLTPQATAQWADQRIKREGSPRGTKGSNPSPSRRESRANLKTTLFGARYCRAQVTGARRYH
jgi:hypothetical protein